MRVAPTTSQTTRPASPSPLLGAVAAVAIAAVVFAAEYTVNRSWLSAPGLAIAPLLGACLAPTVRADVPVLGWVSVRMAGAAVILGAFATPIVWSGGGVLENLTGVLFVGVIGLVIFGLPMFGVTLLCAMVWLLVVRSVAAR